MSEDIAKADLQFRHRLFLTYGIALIMMVLLPWKMGPDVVLLFHQASNTTKLWVAEWTSILVLLAFIPPSLYLIHHGKKTLAEGRYPHSSMKVIYDTRIQRGIKAQYRGRSLSILGGVCIGMVVLGIGATHFIFYKFIHDPQFFTRF